MDEYTDQQAWDECLIRGWRSEISMSMLVAQFLLIRKPSLIGHKGGFSSVDEVSNYLSSLDIRRCKDRVSPDELRFVSWHGPVRAFVASRSSTLNNALWNEKNTAESILENISTFKWTRKNMKNFNDRGHERRSNHISRSCDKVVKARSLDKRHDWNTVK